MSRLSPQEKNRRLRNLYKDESPAFRAYKRVMRGVCGASTWADMNKQVLKNRTAHAMKLKRRAIRSPE